MFRPPTQIQVRSLADNRRTLVGNNAAEGARFPNAHF